MNSLHTKTFLKMWDKGVEGVKSRLKAQTKHVKTAREKMENTCESLMLYLFAQFKSRLYTLLPLNFSIYAQS